MRRVGRMKRRSILKYRRAEGHYIKEEYSDDVVFRELTSESQKVLKKLEELTSESQKVANVKKILKEVDEDLKKTIDVMRCDEVKSSASILLSSFQNSEEYLAEIYNRIRNEEKVFAVRKIEDEVKYGKVLMFENKLFFHSLSLSEVPKDSSLIWVS
ncbi:hypothetical protein Avbf_07830 [Armadillidium vulgare]|nr:hypothetical protein Avbf_07830 [Armadillidium vulgare]